MEKFKLPNKSENTLKKAPEGWETSNSLAEENGVSQPTIIRIADKYRDKGEEYFQHFKNTKNKVLEYYSPELVGMIINEIKEKKEAPEGWQTSSSISAQLETVGLRVDPT